MPDGVSSALYAGVYSGVAGLLVFLVIHHLWIRPIWFILPVGLLFAPVEGMAAGWAYHELLPGLPPRPWSALALIGLIVAMLAPAVILAEMRSPLLSRTGSSAALTASTGRAVLTFVLELLVTATIVGALAGWWIGGSGRGRPGD